MSENLRKVNFQLQDNNTLLDTFNYHISHDLKATMNNQIGLSAMMAKYIEDSKYEKVSEIMKMMAKVAEDGLSMVERFLDISKEGFNWNNGINENINVKEIIEGTASKLRINDNFNLVIKSSDFEMLRVGRSAFESIILNLFSNAIKYNENQAEIEVNLKHNKNVNIISISDNGIGIDMEKHGMKIFDPFYRTSTNKKKEGTGIGLFIVKKLVHANMGEIYLESEPGKGSTFTLRFEN